MKRVILSESKHFLGWAVVPSPGEPTRWGLVPRAQKAKLLFRLLRHSSLQLSFPRDGWDGLSPVEALTYYKLRLQLQKIELSTQSLNLNNLKAERSR